jgi:hypothetical protein
MEILGIGGSVQTLQGWMTSMGMSDGLALLMTALASILGGSLVVVGIMVGVWRNRKALLRDRDLKLARFQFPALPGVSLFNALRLPVPSFSFDLSGGRGIVTALGIVGVAFGVAFSFVVATTDDTPTWPESGAVYYLPSVFGTPLDPDEGTPATRSQTLQINLADGVRLDKLHLKNLDLGKAGLDSAFQIARTSGVTGAMVNVGLITIRNSSAPTLDFANIETGCLTLAGDVDGHTNAVQIDSTISNLVIDSDRGAGSYVVENSTVDRIIINTNGDNGATIGEILIDDVDASVGSWDWDYIKAGCIVFESTNQFGNGTGVNVSSATWNASVKSRVVTDNLVDTPISVR